MKVFLNPGHAPGGHPDPGPSIVKAVCVSAMSLWQSVNLRKVT
jgi:hypothetical protein